MSRIASASYSAIGSISRVPLDVLKAFEVIGAAGDGLFENRGIRRGAAKAVFSNQPSELTAREQASAQVVQPDRLAKRLQGADQDSPARCAVLCAVADCAVGASGGGMDHG